MKLEDSKRKINDLRMQLTSANQVIQWIEKEKAEYLNEKMQLQLNYDNALKERESLLRQTHEAKVENISLKLNVQKLKETIDCDEAKKKTLEVSVREIQERFLKIKDSFER